MLTWILNCGRIMIFCSSRTIDKGEGTMSTKQDKKIWNYSGNLLNLSCSNFALAYSQLLSKSYLAHCRLGACSKAIKAKHLANYLVSIWTVLFLCCSLFMSPQRLSSSHQGASHCLCLLCVRASATHCLRSHHQENLKIPFHTFLNSSAIFPLKKKKRA